MFDFDVRSGSFPPSLGAGGDQSRIRVLRDAFAEPVSQVPRRPPLVIPPSLPLATALRAMAEHRAAAAVVAGQGILMGTVHGRDVARRVLEGLPAASNCPVTEVMTSDGHCLLENDSVAYAVTKLWTLGGRPLPIVCHNGAVQGLLETEDLAAWLCEAAGVRGAFRTTTRVINRQ